MLLKHSWNMLNEHATVAKFYYHYYFLLLLLVLLPVNNGIKIDAVVEME